LTYTPYSGCPGHISSQSRSARAIIA
jgi:hypothetical protein